MRLFITGATGFIGRRLLKRLEATSHTCRCLVRPSSRTEGLGRDGVETVVGDIGQRSSLRQGMAGCDAVVHLANLYSFWEKDPSRFAAANIDGTRNVLEEALAAGVQKVVHVSSVVVFGRPEEKPFTEESPWGEAVFSEYARTKRQGDRIARALRDERGLPLVVLYPAGVLGPGDPQSSGRYIADLVGGRLPARLLEDAVNTWVYVDDVAEAVVRGLEAPVGGEYIIGKERCTWGELNRMVAQIAGVRLPLLHMPWALAWLSGEFLTGLAAVTGRPPLWGMAREALRTVRAGIEAEGALAERALGLEYTGLQEMLERTIAE